MATEYTADESNDTVAQALSTNIGYAVEFPRIRDHTWESVNGWLYAPDGIYFPLFITEYFTSFELAGNTGQSQMVRDFYPRNFTQPELRITGQSPNQHYYNRVGEFIRYFQRKAVTTASPGRLVVPDSKFNRTARNPGVSHRGLNKGFIAEGYVKDADRGGERFQFAPDFSFEFTVSNMIDGLYQEDPVKIHKLRSWAEIFKDPDHIWEADPDVVETVREQADAVQDQQALIHGWQWLQEFLGIK